MDGWMDGSRQGMLLASRKLPGKKGSVLARFYVARGDAGHAKGSFTRHRKPQKRPLTGALGASCPSPHLRKRKQELAFH